MSFAESVIVAGDRSSGIAARKTASNETHKEAEIALSSAGSSQDPQCHRL